MRGSYLPLYHELVLRTAILGLTSADLAVVAAWNGRAVPGIFRLSNTKEDNIRFIPTAFVDLFG